MAWRVCSLNSNLTGRPVFFCRTIARSAVYPLAAMSSTLIATTSQPRSLLSIARLNMARSRSRPSIWSFVRIDQTCFGRSGGFAPVSLPLFQGRVWMWLGRHSRCLAWSSSSVTESPAEKATARCCAWTAAACIVQHPCRRLLLPADPDLRGDDRPARAVAAAPRQAAIGRGSRANPASRHRSHPSQLARGRDHGARRQSLRDARSDGPAGREALRLYLRTVYQHALERDRAALERGCRHTPSVVKNAKDAALLPDQLCRSQLAQAPQGRRPRRGERARQRCALHRHQPARPGKSPLRKGLLRARAHGESHQGHEALHALRPHLLPPLGGQSVPPVPSHGSLLAPARTQGRCAETLNLAYSDLRDYSLRVPQDRGAHRRAQDPATGAIGCVSLVKRVLNAGSDGGNQCSGANSSHFLPALPL